MDPSPSIPSWSIASILDPASWPETFASFTPLHALVVAAAVGLTAAACVLGRWLGPGSAAERRVRRGWGVSIAGVFVVHAIYWLHPDRYRLDVSLPLHFCDLAAIVAVIVIFTEARWARGLLLFWGVGFSSWAFVLPVIDEGPRDALFWLFWIAHLQVVGTPVYDVVVGGYRPGWRDWCTSMVITAGYTIAVTPLNWWADLSYGYLGPSGTGGNSPIDQLGPWPLRLLPLTVFAAVTMGTIVLVVRLLPGGVRTGARSGGHTGARGPTVTP